MRRWPIGIGLLAALLIAANYLPLLWSHAEQDDCVFGPVSNAQYRSFLSEAKARQRQSWPAPASDSGEITRGLTNRLIEMSTGEASIYARMATAHAILRALGADYLNMNGRNDTDPYQAALSRRENIVFNYQIDINRLVWFQPYPRQVWIQAVFADPIGTRPETLSKFGALRLVATVVSVFDRPPDSFLARSGKNCPPMPSAEIAARLEQRSN